MAQHEAMERWFNNAKGYAFLGRDDDSDAFVHFTSVQSEGYKSIKENKSARSVVLQRDKRTTVNRMVPLKRKN